ncbi:hypothetical protein Tco_0702019 [Tanacetum coccineum]|uniref:Uncharacterized protein n=1 Tax=Tanacetum coccineum TaxID=301880 RepID=A0ABQ4XUS9_9ASTR
MASLDYRLNPLFTIKECSSCGSLYNKGYCCTPDSCQQLPQDCVKCGNPVEGPNYQGCALWQKKLKEVWFTICHENGIYQDLLNTYESSDDDSNVVNAPREPVVVKHDPSENSSQNEYKDNGRFWGSKSGCNESDVKPFWKDIEKAKACMLAKAQASKASSKAKLEACGSKVKVEACGSKAKIQASTKTLIVKSHGRGTLEVESDVNLLYDVMHIEIIEISSDSSEDRKWASKATALIFYGPSTQGLLDAYGYNIIEEYLSWNYFPSTDNESTDMETIDKRNTDNDCIIDSNSVMSKGEYVPVCKKHKPNMYSHVPVTGSVLGLPNVTTWDEIKKKIGTRKSKTCVDKAKGKRKVSCRS